MSLQQLDPAIIGPCLHPGDERQTQSEATFPYSRLEPLQFIRNSSDQHQSEQDVTEFRK